MFPSLRRLMCIAALTSVLAQTVNAASSSESTSVPPTIFRSEALAPVSLDGAPMKLLPEAPALSNLVEPVLANDQNSNTRDPILEESKSLESSPGPEWNDTRLWINQQVSPSGRKLAAAVRSHSPKNDLISEVASIVEYDRDPQTGHLSNGHSVIEAGVRDVLDSALYYTSDDRLTFFSLVAEKVHHFQDPDTFTGTYLLNQRRKEDAKMVIKAEVLGYAESPRLRLWVPKLSPDGAHVLFPILR